jgi:hypothetical protein
MGTLVRAAVLTISAGIATLVIGVVVGEAVRLHGLSAGAPVGIDFAASRLPMAVIEADSHLAPQLLRDPRSRALALAIEPVSLTPGETPSATDGAAQGEQAQPEEEEPLTEPRASFDDRFLFTLRVDTFSERFAAKDVAVPYALSSADDDNDGPLPTRTATKANAQAIASSGGEHTRSASEPPAKKSITVANLARDLSARDLGSAPDSDGHTAIYDIASHVVYLPDGHKLEAHSGLGNHLDNPRYVSLKNLGPTPPHVYDLVLREQSFHGVRALRLIPVGDGDMFGRDGILAHSYMLGPNGQSNGCVSFNDYPAFLNAFLKGEVDRLIVVDHLTFAPRA